jgi:VanZ family protein
MLKLIIYLRPIAKYLLIAWALTILTLSSIPNIPTLKLHTGGSEIRLDYLMHFVQYGILTFVTFLSFSGSSFEIGYGKVLLLTAGLILFATADEFHQKLIPGRSFSYRDILSNLSGVVIVAIITLVIFRSLRIRLKNS